MLDFYKFTPQQDIQVPMANEMLELYRQNPTKEMIDMIVRLARAWNRHDVWRCVFESEPSVYRAIFTDEIYNGAAQAAQNYTRALHKSPKSARAILNTVRMHSHAWKYPEIYDEVFQHYGVDHFGNYRGFDSPMEVIGFCSDFKYPLLLNRVWNEGESNMFFTGIYGSRSFKHDELGHSPLQMFFADGIILPESYQAHLDSLTSDRAQEKLQGL